MSVERALAKEIEPELTPKQIRRLEAFGKKESQRRVTFCSTRGTVRSTSSSSSLAP